MSAYLIRAKHSGLVICVADASRDNGANIHQWEYIEGALDQQIILQRLP
jgi:hypothetical protein